MRKLLLWLGLALGSLPSAVQAASILIVVPNGLLDTDGNDATRLPFSYLGQVRYQQVYDASQFSMVPAGGSFLSRIYLTRVDCSSTKSWLVTNLQVNISTTAKGPDTLSPVFAENVGMDEIVTFGPAPYAPSLAGCGNFFTGTEINATIPFFYDSTKGNLLLDLRNFGIDFRFGDPTLDSQKMDAQTVFGDSISRAAAFSLSTNMAEVVDTTGLVTAFQFDPVPSLQARFETNTLIITFDLYPTAFVLHWAERIGPGTQWTNYPGPIDQIGFFRFARIPAGSLQAPKFFRLFLQTPQPLSPQARRAITTKRALQAG